MHPRRHDIICRLGIGLQYWDAYLLWKMKFMAKSFVYQAVLHEGRSGRGDLKDIFVEVYHFGCKKEYSIIPLHGDGKQKVFFCFPLIFM